MDGSGYRVSGSGSGSAENRDPDGGEKTSNE